MLQDLRAAIGTNGAHVDDEVAMVAGLAAGGSGARGRDLGRNALRQDAAAKGGDGEENRAGQTHLARWLKSTVEDIGSWRVAMDGF